MTTENQVATATTNVDLQARRANIFAKSPLIPEHYKHKVNGQIDLVTTAANVYIALEYADHMRLPAQEVMAGSFVVHGVMGWKSAFMIARANASGIFDGPLRYEKDADGGIRVTAKVNGEVYEGPSVSMDMAKAEGWTKNPKYKSMPEMMLRYRAATFFIRLTCPQVLMGLRTAEELEDMAASGDLPRDVEVEPSAADALNAELEAKPDAEPDAPREVESDEPEVTDQEADEQAARDAWAKGGAA